MRALLESRCSDGLRVTRFLRFVPPSRWLSFVHTHRVLNPTISAERCSPSLGLTLADWLGDALQFKASRLKSSFRKTVLRTFMAIRPVEEVMDNVYAKLLTSQNDFILCFNVQTRCYAKCYEKFASTLER